MTPTQTRHIEEVESSRLSVQISLDGLSFLAIDPIKKETLFFLEKKLDHSTTPEEVLMEIEHIMETHDFLDHKFTEVILIYSTSIYSLVPLSLFDESRAADYLKFNSKILANDYIAHDVIEKQGIVVVYVPFMNINNYFFEKYGSFNYYHSTTVMLKTILEKELYSLPKMYINFQQHCFDCVVLKNGRLELCNTYTYHTAEDFIYYTLFCMEQLKLDPETLSVLLCGDIGENDDTYKIAYTYIRNIEFAGTDFNSFTIDGQEEAHRHFILKALA